LAQQSQIHEYIGFLLDRAKGKVKTGAKYIRDMVLSHPKYNQDSIVTPEISNDIKQNVIELSTNSELRNHFLGKK
jgi:glutamate--cysteine ligase catalytic subunit